MKAHDAYLFAEYPFLYMAQREHVPLPAPIPQHRNPELIDQLLMIRAVIFASRDEHDLKCPCCGQREPTMAELMTTDPEYSKFMATLDPVAVMQIATNYFDGPW